MQLPRDFESGSAGPNADVSTGKVSGLLLSSAAKRLPTSNTNLWDCLSGAGVVR